MPEATWRINGGAKVTPGSVWLLCPCYFHYVPFLFIDSKGEEYCGNKQRELICAQYLKKYCSFFTGLCFIYLIFFKG